MRPLEQLRIGILEGRLSDEAASLIERLGGVPVRAPAVREIRQREASAEQIRRLVDGVYDLVVFLTGAGATALLQDAHDLGLLAEARGALEKITIACRGPKPLAALRRHGLAASITTAKPHTSNELLAALEPLDLHRATALLVHYGERQADLAESLSKRVERLDEACPYVWRLPEDPQPLASLIVDVLNGQVDALVVTSQVQCRHLFQVAAEMRLTHELSSALNRDVVVGVVGPVCAATAKQLGVTPDVMPAAPHMTSLVTALGDYFELLRDTPPE